MERHDEEVVRRRERAARVPRAPDLRRAGQEHEHVALEPLADEPGHRRRDLGLEGAIVLVRERLDRDGVGAPLAAHAGRVAEEGGDRRGVERRRHDDEREVGPRPEPEAAEHRQRDVAREVALVELVEDDGAHAREERVGEEAPREHALGHEPQARPRPRDLLEADLEADLVAEPPAALLGDAPRRQARREPARLEHDDLAVAGDPRVEERGGHAGRLARAGRRLEDAPPAPPHAGDDLGQQRVDRERQHEDRSEASARREAAPRPRKRTSPARRPAPGTRRARSGRGERRYFGSPAGFAGSGFFSGAGAVDVAEVAPWPAWAAPDAPRSPP